ncbi:MAG TPA: hypothetical protein VF765_17190 [Polyangiaceae bacterium]
MPGAKESRRRPVGAQGSKLRRHDSFATGWACKQDRHPPRDFFSSIPPFTPSRRFGQWWLASVSATAIWGFSTAAGSNAEVRAALRVAIAWGYVSACDVDAGEQLLDRIAAMLYRLGARR